MLPVDTMESVRNQKVGIESAGTTPLLPTCRDYTGTDLKLPSHFVCHRFNQTLHTKMLNLVGRHLRQTLLSSFLQFNLARDLHGRCEASVRKVQGLGELKPPPPPHALWAARAAFYGCSLPRWGPGHRGRITHLLSHTYMFSESSSACASVPQPVIAVIVAIVANLHYRHWAIEARELGEYCLLQLNDILLSC